MDKQQLIAELGKLEELLEGVDSFTSMSYGKDDVHAHSDSTGPKEARQLLTRILASVRES